MRAYSDWIQELKQELTDEEYKILFPGEFGDNNKECDFGNDNNDAYDRWRDAYYDREYAERGEE